MGSVSLPTIAIIAAAGTAVGSGVAAVSAHEQGIATADSDKRKANAEALQAKQQQINMRQRMLAGLASQNAGTLGAIGTGGASSFGAATMRQLTEGQNDLLVNSANSSSQISLLDQGASNAEATGTLGAAADVLGGVTKVASMYGKST